MKNITKSILVLLGVFAMSCSNDDVEDRPVITATDAPVLTAPLGGTYVLNIDDAAIQADRFVWSSANFDQDVAITYTLELDKAGNEFAAPQSLGSAVSENSLSVSVESLNGAAILAGGTPFQAGDFEVRVKAAVNDTFEPMYSNAIVITVTPYVSVVPPLYFVGAPQAYYGVNAWTPENGIEMRYIGDGVTKLYEAYVKVNAGDGFKFVDDLSWNEGNYGTIGGAQDGNLKNGGDSSDIKVAETDGAGLYYVQVDIDNLKYKAVKMNWGIIGDATPGGWSDETAMTYDFATNKFSITTDLTAAGLKYRAGNAGTAIDGNAWKFNVGNSDPKVTYNPDAPNFTIAAAGSHSLELTINFDGTATTAGE
jgi:hypothetical protein